MADGSNLKAKVGMDTGDFERGARKVTKAAQSMGKDMTTSLTDVGKAIGVDTGLLGDMAGRIQNATTLFRGMGSAGGGAASSLTRAMTGLAGAIAGLGITAAITAFKELNREAENFEQRLQGVNLAASANAYRETYRQALDDMTGRGERTATWWEELKDNFSRDWTDLMHIGASSQQRAIAHNLAVDAANLASERVDIQREMDAFVVTEAQYRKDINDQLLIAKDRSKSKAERDAAQAEAVRLTNKLYDDQIELSGRVLANQEAQDALTSNTDAETRETYQAQANMLRLESQRTQELTTLNKLENTIAGSKESQASAAKETQQATELTLAAATALVEKERALKAIQDQNSAMKAAARFRMDGALQPVGSSGLQRGAEMMTIPALIRPQVDTQAARVAIMDLTDIVLEGSMSMTSAIGELLGDLVTGGDAWGNFANTALSTFADMAISVGKMAVATGAAAAGIQVALESLNPAVAMAAGAALIALGSAVKAGLSNVAGGNYSASASVASSAYSGGSSNTPTAYGREMTVHVTGTLTGEGSKLVAVLNNEADRKRVTT